MIEKYKITFRWGAVEHEPLAGNDRLFELAAELNRVMNYWKTSWKLASVAPSMVLSKPQTLPSHGQYYCIYSHWHLPHDILYSICFQFECCSITLSQYHVQENVSWETSDYFLHVRMAIQQAFVCKHVLGLWIVNLNCQMYWLRSCVCNFMSIYNRILNVLQVNSCSMTLCWTLTMLGYTWHIRNIGLSLAISMIFIHGDASKWYIE